MLDCSPNAPLEQAYLSYKIDYKPPPYEKNEKRLGISNLDHMPWGPNSKMDHLGEEG